MFYPYNTPDEELISYWNDNYQKLSKQECKIVLDEIINRPELNFNSKDMPLDMFSMVQKHLSENITRGIYLSQPHGEMIHNGEKSVVIKSRKYPLSNLYNVLLSGDKAYGYVRFTQPETVTKSDLAKFSDAHKVSEEDISRWWPNKDSFVLYGVRDYFPFSEPRLTKNVEGSQIFVDPVEFLEVPDDLVVKTSSHNFDFVDMKNRLVYGPALIPDYEDTQGDIITADEIRKAAHNFMLDSQTLGIEHRIINVDIRVIESYIAPADMVLGSSTVKKGTWVIGAKILNEKIWEEVEKGNLQGFSIEGYGTRYTLGENNALS